ncbi:MAG: glycosyltransferase family 4 protein [Rhodospirillaceae bacterium]|nr:glycosyltransferase family 4 protein [Rhodospirillaceae bacterium]
MRIVVASSFVPFVAGGGRFIVDWLVERLRTQGHRVEKIYLPFLDDPSSMLDQCLAYRLIDLAASADRLIAIRPPAHIIPHPNKVLWFIHHFRGFYDMWDTVYRPVPADRPESHALRRRIWDMDDAALREARRILTISRVVAKRLNDFNRVESEVVYPPLNRPEQFRCDDYGDEILCFSRVEYHKRQDLLVEAMRHVKTPVTLRLCGTGLTPAYRDDLVGMIERYALHDKVTFDYRWVSEAEKIDRFARALAIAYVPSDEDGVGYPALEAAPARKPVVTTTDSGAVVELLEDGVNGHVVPPDPAAIADAFDRLYFDRARARRMGEAHAAHVAGMNITWDRVLERMLS